MPVGQVIADYNSLWELVVYYYNSLWELCQVFFEKFFNLFLTYFIGCFKGKSIGLRD